ncbi:MAG: BON domain-containing protein [Methylovulum sp.]|nr:MAG: BON domain-containing protein [Methylovulum sp.]
MKILCLSSLLITGLAVSGCAGVTANDPAVVAEALHDRRAPAVIASDKTIEADIIDELQGDNELQIQAHVNINAYNGAVLVSGEAATDALKNKIIDVVRTTRHVKLVHNNLNIAYPSDMSSRANDAQINDNIKAALAQIRTIPNFESAMVKVVTENAVVYLMGRVHRSEGAVVINVVRHQPEVKQIITVFEYLD